MITSGVQSAFRVHQCGPSVHGARARSEASGELPLREHLGLNEQGLVDRLMRNPHRLIIGEVDPKAVGDLFGAPRRSPPPVLTAAVPAPDPPRIRTVHGSPVGRGDLARQPILTYSLKVSLAASLATFGRRARRSAATAKSWPGSPDTRRGSRRCDATPAKSSMHHGQ